MSAQPQSFRKKPVEVEAMRLTWDDLTDVKAWCGGNVAYGCGVAIGLTIDTREGFMLAELGDWIIKEPFPTADRRFYPCKPELFDATYEPEVPA